MTKPWLSLLLALPTLLAGATASARVNVVATLPDLAALAMEIGGAEVDVTALARPTEDPHYVDPKPSLLLPLAKADLLVLNGLDLEIGWLPPLLVNARNANIQPGGAGYLDASTLVPDKLQVPAGRIDRAQGDIHPGGNPHFTHDPRRAAEIAVGLGERLAAIDPAHAADYKARAQKVAGDLRGIAKAERARFAALPEAKRRVVVYHDSWVYVIDWLGLTQVATVEEKPGIKPSPGHVAQVLKTMRERGARLIIQEEYYPRKTSETLSQLASGELSVMRGGTHLEKGETYAHHARETAEALYKELSK
ncbi:MAG: zinc ABC transporter substrate-binding protein [Myxococcales bacterium]|nr:zinc ABC transporter substrate-binding protein [Myxococcales bacterium]MCB9736242.1 zinc ABC transporter substrate-binding protein [Deltaproteobacteria bacterium]